MVRFLKMVHCCCGLKILDKWQMVNESVTDTSFRSLGKQMKVKYISDGHFLFPSSCLANVQVGICNLTKL